MLISSREQQEIQSIIDSSSLHELREREREVDRLLGSFCDGVVTRKRALTSLERMEVERAIELLVRCEARIQGKGWWFRQKRRFELVREHLAS